MNVYPPCCINCSKGGFDMRIYHVDLDGAAVGQVQVTAKGLYYAVSCRCQLPDKIMYRLQLCSCEKTSDLGILIPEDGAFILKTMIPIKRIGSGELAFRIVADGRSKKERFIALDVNEPFLYIACLETARFGYADNCPGVYIDQC